MAEEFPALSAEDYAAIEAAVMETARGRWFLAEYAKRNRNADTTVLLEALNRIERTVQADRGDVVQGVQRDLLDMAAEIARARSDIADSVARSGPKARPASPQRAFIDLARTVEAAGSGLQAVSEQVQEIAWSIHQGQDPVEIAAELDQQVLNLRRIAESHAMANQRVHLLIDVLHRIEVRIHVMIGSGNAGLFGSENSDVVWKSSDLDGVEDPSGRTEGPRAPSADPPPAPQPTTVALPPPRPAPRAVAEERPPADKRAVAFAAIDALDTEQKLALFA